MRPQAVSAFLLLLASLACSGLPFPVPGEDAEVIPTDAGVPADGTATAEPAPPPEPAGSTELPESPFTGVAGFVGIAVDETATDWWIPQGGGGLLVAGEAFNGVATGSTFHAVHRGGTTEITFDGVQEVAWGCDKTKAAVFTPKSPVGSGLVWIVADAGGLTAKGVEERREPAKSWRLFRLPNGAEFDVKPGRTVIEQVGGRPWVHTWPGVGANLLESDSPGPHWPELVVIDSEGLLVIMRTHTDGYAWEVLRIVGKEGQELGRQSAGISACAAS